MWRERWQRLEIPLRDYVRLAGSNLGIIPRSERVHFGKDYLTKMAVLVGMRPWQVRLVAAAMVLNEMFLEHGHQHWGGAHGDHHHSK